MQFDHLFLFVAPADAEPGGHAFDALRGIGLRPSYRRRHDGQGTANVCWCFDNAYLELLFVVDKDELAASGPRNGFVSRSGGSDGASPFGVAVRGELAGESGAGESGDGESGAGGTWPYRIDAFPPGLSIPVSIDSDDVRLPFVFGSPGTSRPDAWTDGRAGMRQAGAGLSTLSVETLILPDGVPASPVLDRLVATEIIGAVERGGAGHGAVLRLGERIRLELTSFRVS